MGGGGGPATATEILDEDTDSLPPVLKAKCSDRLIGKTFTGNPWQMHGLHQRETRFSTRRTQRPRRLLSGS